MDVYGATSRSGRPGSRQSRPNPTENLRVQEGRSGSVNAAQSTYPKHIGNDGDTAAQPSTLATKRRFKPTKHVVPELYPNNKVFWVKMRQEIVANTVSGRRPFVDALHERIWRPGSEEFALVATWSGVDAKAAKR